MIVYESLAHTSDQFPKHIFQHCYIKHMLLLYMKCANALKYSGGERLQNPAIRDTVAVLVSERLISGS
jgi:hypothetical protein